MELSYFRESSTEQWTLVEAQMHFQSNWSLHRVARAERGVGMKVMVG